MLYLLDTDHVTLLQRPGPNSVVAVRLATLAADDYGTFVITL